MNRLIFGLVLGCFAIQAQDKVIAKGSNIYVEAEKGFDIYLTAALQKKKVPVQVVDSKERADYVLVGNSSHEEKGWASKVFLNHRDSSDAAVKLVDAKNGDIVWSYVVHKKNSVRAHQSTAEACAKHLKEVVK